MFDRVVPADRRGCIDDRLYSQLPRFYFIFIFYFLLKFFLPMVVEAPLGYFWVR